MITDRIISIPESKLIVSKLRRDAAVSKIGEELRLDYFHKMTVTEVVTELKKLGFKGANESYVLEAARRIIRV
jgi:hypothetical protein